MRARDAGPTPPNTTAAGQVAGAEEASLRALTRIEQVLPSRLRHQVAALKGAVVAMSPGNGSTVEVDGKDLASVAFGVQSDPGDG
ncbi:hypothetical protein [Streptosporangium minutum]|uniref:Uncharacterized protein n=1 Tax=Streptosporangium minutum TaxID=569862 RepID=A0A243RV59_9ACTN|nr:hypothetical protein CA984_04685 [Streptosporangium minutum]